MSRIPSGLLYLAIYNPTLRPKQPIDEDDEDAEEQAHILFYTSKERAVSRDRMLRQIGLAKALVNFADLFNPNDKCESIHSQTRRMVLVAPEPNFWINAAVELPKTLQKSSAQGKGSGSKGKPKGSSTTAAKNQQAEGPDVYDYEDGTVHDIALRSRLMHAYERFKLLHGSFTSILAEMGQEALELQLERFFTVWAWSWNLEAKPQIAEQLGLPLQPYYNALIPLLDGFSANLPETIVPVILTQTAIVPSTRYVAKEYPSALAEHLMSMVPPPTAIGDDPLTSSVDTIQPPIIDAAKSPGSTGIFGLPAVNVNMDVRKWNWQGYLTFGKGGSSSSSKSSGTGQKDSKEEREVEQEEQKGAVAIEIQPPSRDPETEESEPPISSPRSILEVDSKALEDALSSEGLLPTAQPEAEKEGEQVDEQPHQPEPEIDNGDAATQPLKKSPSMDDDSHSLLTEEVSYSPLSSMTILPRPLNREPSSRSPSPPPIPTFSRCGVHLSSSEDAVVTQRRNVHYYIRNGTMIALLGADDPGFAPSEVDDLLSTAAQNITRLLDEMDLTVENAALSKLSESLPSANKILQTPDQYAISTDQYLLQSSGFASDSSYLQNATSLLDKDLDVLEVYTRGQNPQYWHVAKRGFSTHESPTSEIGPSNSKGKAFLEVFRKEASLPDVDNVLAGLLRKSGISESVLAL